MKSSSYVIKGVLAAFMLLSILSFSSCKEANGGDAKGQANNSGEGGYDGVTLPIAYINVDSVLINYEYAKEVNERMIKKMEDMRVSVNQGQKKLEAEYNEFNRKLQNNAFLSEQRAQQEATRIQKMEQDWREKAARMEQELAIETQKENGQIADSVRNAVKIHNETAKYELVLTGSDLILENPKYDITEDILALLNARFKAAPKK